MCVILLLAHVSYDDTRANKGVDTAYGATATAITRTGATSTSSIIVRRVPLLRLLIVQIRVLVVLVVPEVLEVLDVLVVLVVLVGLVYS